MKVKSTVTRAVVVGIAALTLVIGVAGQASADTAAPTVPDVANAIMTTDNGTTVEAPDATGNPCATIWIGVSSSLFGALLWDWRQTTHYCWNGSIVTSHSTSYSWHITSWGSVSGYAWLGLAYNHFNCYVASGSTRNCSGNYESLAAMFGQNTGTIGGGSGQCVQTQQWETFRGGSTQKAYLNNYPNSRNVPCIIH